MRNKLWVLCFLLFFAATGVRADVALLLEEPYGGFGALNPTGHAAVYLPRVCAATPTVLRMCLPGETGVVISRYYKVAGYDWLAIPLIPYLYAVDDLTQVPESATSQLVNHLRDGYRRGHLEMLVPDGPNGETPGGEWTLLAGKAYDRKIYGFQIETSEAQDEELIRVLNEKPNHSPRRDLASYLLSRNCADFARGILNFYYPHSVHRNFFADAGITTPKQVAKSLVKYARRHDGLQFWSFVVPQVPGNIPRSHPVNGVAEALVRSKKYLAPLAVLHPIIMGGVAVLYIGKGRFNPAHEAGLLPESPQIAALLDNRPKDPSVTAQVGAFKSKQIAHSLE